MKYKLNDESKIKKMSLLSTLSDANKFLGGFGKKVIILTIVAFTFVLITSLINVYGPSAIGDATKDFIKNGDKDGLGRVVLGLLGLYVLSAVTNYFQIVIMGWVGQDILARLRNKIFAKIQALPLAFFNDNKSGDLISRINTDTDTLNQALSQTLLRFVGNVFIIIGIGIAMVVINPTLGIIALSVAVVLFLITSLLGGLFRRLNKQALNTTGILSGEVQESLSNFKVIVAYNRRDYFRDSFKKVNEKNKEASIKADIANSILSPIYDFGGNVALFLIYFVGVNLILFKTFTLLGIQLNTALEFGTLISYILYVDRFYTPLRNMAQLFASIQTSIAAWARISELLRLESDLTIHEKDGENQKDDFIIKFENVSFGYNVNKLILKKVNLEIKRGHTVALVGPTGGGKSTTAALIDRLYDPTEGKILFDDTDLKTISRKDISHKIGFILQDPFLFTGTIKENIVYGNSKYEHMDDEGVEKVLEEKGLTKLLERFPERLSTKVSNSTDNISLGQKQLVAFLRIMLREPELLILDEATANIDTITEHYLQEIISKLPASTTKIIIAHRLNTIEKADTIFFIANGEISKPVSFTEAINMIQHNKAKS